MVLPQLLDGLLLCGVVLRPDDFVHPPFVAAGRAEHAAHEVIAPIGVGKGVQRVVAVHPELLRGDEDGAAGAQGDVAHIVPHCACPHGCRGIVPGPCRHFDGCGDAQLLCRLGKQGANGLIALIAFRQLGHLDAADIAHLLGPLTVLHIEQQHP